jgi:hypothetical protein
MKTSIAVLMTLFVAIPLAVSQEADKKVDNHKFNKAEYLVATATGQVKAGAPVKGTLFFDNEKKTVTFLQESGSSILDIQYDSIKDITYEKASKPRYAEAVLISPFFLLSNSKKHYLTFQYDDPSGKGKYAIIHLDKKNAREAVACAEAQTGKKVEQITEK